METKLLEMTIGQGPAECSWALPKIFNIFKREAEDLSIKIAVINRIVGDETNTVKSLTIELSGNHLSTFCKRWLGSIKWQGKSPYRRNHKRKNWFIGVFEIDGTTTMKFKDEDVEYQAMRSSGAGGQHVNKVNSAIRAVHLPTGISAIGKERRSQLQNKKQAKERLLEKLKKNQFEQVKENAEINWLNHYKVERGKAVRTFVFEKNKREPKKNYKSKRNQLKNDLRTKLE
ncbi:MAG: peptide chain release factor H [Flavobacteriales bacterium]